MNRNVFGLAACLLCFSATAVAGPFEGSELLIGRSMKQPTKSQFFAIGLDVQVSPLAAAMATQRDSIIGEAVNAQCDSAPDPVACKAAAQANTEMALDAMGAIPDSQWEAINASLMDPDGALVTNLNAAGIDDPTQVAAIQEFVKAVPEDQREDAVALAKQLSQDDPMTFILEPYLTLNFDAVAVTASLPLAAYQFTNKTEINVGNFVLDAKFGKIVDLAVINAGYSYGASVYLPTGSKEADPLAKMNLFYSPKYLHQYMTIAPYGVVGIDTFLATLQAHVEFVGMMPVRDSKGVDSVMYAKYGVGAIVLADFLFSAMAEINGLYPLNDAADKGGFDAIYGSAAAQINLSIIKATFGAMVPLVKPGQKTAAQGGKPSLDEVADWMVMGRLTLGF
jgi:hypothetical protein